MRLLLLSHYFEPENGAPQRRWSALIEQFVASGWEVDVIAPEPHHPGGRRMEDVSARAGSTAMGAHGARVHRVSFLPHDGSIARRTLDHLWVALATIRRADALVRRDGFRPDVVVATAPALPTILAGSRVAKRHGLKLVIEMRDAWPDLISYTPGLRDARSVRGRVKRALHAAITRMQRGADVVVTTTESFADILRTRGVSDVVVIRNGTLPERYEGIGPAQDDHAELRALYMGTVGRSQGLETVVRAAAKLKDERLAVDVRIVGSGAEHAQLRDLNHRLGSPVDLRREVRPDEVVHHYQWADTCVVSLRAWEPFRWTVPSKLYELMATGKHLTALLSGEAAEIVRAAQTGLLVEPGDVDALVAGWRSLAHDRSALAIGTGGREWVRRNAAYHRLGQQYLAVFGRLADGSVR